MFEGKDAWNEIRQSQDFRPDFSYENFSAEFRKADKLQQDGSVWLGGYNLVDAIFRETNLSRVSFFNANLERAIFNDTSLKGTNFSLANLTEAEFPNCDLTDVSFASAVLEKTDLVGINLSGANLGRSQYWQARLFRGSKNLDEVPTPKIHIIRNVAELLKTCFNMKSRFSGNEIFFRGERDSSWCLYPSVMRPSKDKTFKLRFHEGEMLRGLISKRPEDFSGMNSALEQMVVAQHHGLRTRLLDVTRNPGVALFNACDDRDPAGTKCDNRMDGRIHVFAAPREMVKSFDSDTISIIANFAKLDRGHQNLILGKTLEESQKENPDTSLVYDYDESLRHLYHYIRQEKPQFEKLIDPLHLLQVFVVEPKQSFERIRAQEGAFLISAFHERFERDQITGRVKNLPIYEYETIVVPSGKKEHIIKELSLLSFTRENLYPSLDEVANRITQPYL